MHPLYPFRPHSETHSQISHPNRQRSIIRACTDFKKSSYYYQNAPPPQEIGGRWAEQAMPSAANLLGQWRKLQDRTRETFRTPLTFFIS